MIECTPESGHCHSGCTHLSITPPFLFAETPHKHEFLNFLGPQASFPRNWFFVRNQFRGGIHFWRHWFHVKELRNSELSYVVCVGRTLLLIFPTRNKHGSCQQKIKSRVLFYNRFSSIIRSKIRLCSLSLCTFWSSLQFPYFLHVFSLFFRILHQESNATYSRLVSVLRVNPAYVHRFIY